MRACLSLLKLRSLTAFFQLQVTVTLLNGPDDSILRCLDKDGFNIPLKDGLASFQGLYINEAGRNYSLRLSTAIKLDGHFEVDSNEFKVGVGQATYIVLINDASVGPVFGGRSFAPQPRVEVRDAGGNVLVEIHHPPSESRFTATPRADSCRRPPRPLEFYRREQCSFETSPSTKRASDTG
jgi:hypothetical protein